MQSLVHCNIHSLPSCISARAKIPLENTLLYTYPFISKASNFSRHLFSRWGMGQRTKQQTQAGYRTSAVNMLLVEVSKALPPKARTNPNYSEQTAPGCQVGQVGCSRQVGAPGEAYARWVDRAPGDVCARWARLPGRTRNPGEGCAR